MEKRKAEELGEREDFNAAMLRNVKLRVTHMPRKLEEDAMGGKGKDPRNLPPEDCEVKERGNLLTLEIRVSNDRGEMGQRHIQVRYQTQLQNWRSAEEVVEVHTIDRTGVFPKRIFREHNRMADTWANRETDGRTESRATTKRLRVVLWIGRGRGKDEERERLGTDDEDTRPEPISRIFSSIRELRRILSYLRKEGKKMVAMAEVSDRGRGSRQGPQERCPGLLTDSSALSVCIVWRVGSRVEHHLSKRDCCGQKECFLRSRSHVACVSNHR